MSVILVSDVFGMTPALLKLKDSLAAKTIVDPYHGECMGFKNEAEAYSYFITTVGFDSYLEKILKVIAQLDSKTTLIGFSVGASAVWRLSLNNKMIKQAFCFYGSQIRNFSEIEPCFKVTLIFPNSEPHFDVTALKDELSKRPNVTTTQVEYLHGFMNYCSSNFNKVGYKKHITLLQSIIS
ncbi:hypothetical protein [Colwellia psychrerythraea]|uniref:Dienelactone hydrolase n=1 Tax=Colwellia psychrerythraea TaxID=28229 RepID=A0A099KAV6_COLPS|nr:hypothetical protein [Colwellia psychrerythraea]KGJ87435.1 dienelactone hydrolase [Colwellia psychrerythraea]